MGIPYFAGAVRGGSASTASSAAEPSSISASRDDERRREADHPLARGLTSTPRSRMALSTPRGSTPSARMSRPGARGPRAAWGASSRTFEAGGGGGRRRGWRGRGGRRRRRANAPRGPGAGQGLPPKVVPRVPGRAPTREVLAHEEAPMGTPPAIPFASVTTSGTTPSCCTARELPRPPDARLDLVDQQQRALVAEPAQAAR